MSSPTPAPLFSARPHWRALRAPCLLLLADAALCVGARLAWRSGPRWFAEALAGLFALGGLYLVGRILSWRATRLEVSGERLSYRRGLLRRDAVVLPLRAIHRVECHQSLLGRLSGVGQLTVLVTGSDEAVVLPDVRRPRSVQNLLTERIGSAADLPRLERERGITEVAAVDFAALHRRGVISDVEYRAREELAGPG